MQPPQITSRYLIFSVVAATLVAFSISSTSVSVAFPALVRDLDTTLVAASWVLNISQLVMTAAMPLSGKLADAFGEKRAFVGCIGLWLGGSVLAGLAPNIEVLLAARFVQALGGGAVMPLSIGIISDLFPDSRQRAIGLTASIMPVGSIIGPNLAGWLISSFGWRSVFWLNVPMAVAAVIPVVILLKGRPPKPTSIDLVGAGLFTGAITAFLVGLSQIGSVAWVWVGLLLGTSIVLMVSFFRHESRTREPVIDITLLRERPFLAANAYNLVHGISLMGAMSFIPLYAVRVYGMSILQSGLILTPRSIGAIATSAVVSLYLVRWGYRRPLLSGTFFVIAAHILLGFELFASGTTSASPGAAWILLVAMGLAGMGMGISGPAASNACIELMPERVATIAGLRGTFRHIGGAIALAIIPAVLTAAGSDALGFRTVFFALAAFTLLSVPLVLFMPAGPLSKAAPSGSKAVASEIIAD